MFDLVEGSREAAEVDSAWLVNELDCRLCRRGLGTLVDTHQTYGRGSDLRERIGLRNNVRSPNTSKLTHRVTYARSLLTQR